MVESTSQGDEMNEKLPDVFCPHCHVLVALVGVRNNRCTARSCGKKLTEPVTLNCRIKIPEIMLTGYQT
jgi:hypothetical protein